VTSHPWTNLFDEDESVHARSGAQHARHHGVRLLQQAWAAERNRSVAHNDREERGSKGEEATGPNASGPRMRTNTGTHAVSDSTHVENELQSSQLLEAPTNRLAMKEELTVRDVGALIGADRHTRALAAQALPDRLSFASSSRTRGGGSGYSESGCRQTHTAGSRQPEPG
jgi:hypothetical protein